MIARNKGTDRAASASIFLAWVVRCRGHYRGRDVDA